MTEVELLKMQIAALEKLVSIKDQTISALQSRPYYYQWPNTFNWPNTLNGGLNGGLTVTTGTMQQGQHYAAQGQNYATQTNTSGLCSIQGSQS